MSVWNLLRERTYLKWETNLDGQAYFWKKLELAMKYKGQNDNVQVIRQLDDETPLLAPNIPPSDPPYHI